jgi:hypothetical protein
LRGIRADANTHAYCKSHSNSYANAITNRDTHAKSNTYTKNSTDPEESTHARASPVDRRPNQSMKPTGWPAVKSHKSRVR